jgi:tetratricopeptide (TPR) repeat protein
LPENLAISKSAEQTVSVSRHTEGPDGWIALGLLAGTLLAYAPSFSSQFVNYDDETYVTDNRHVLTGLSAENFKWAFSTFHSGNWHPLTWLSLQTDASLFDTKPSAFHATNVFWHCLNTVLLFAVLRNLTGAVWRSALVAALFGWHPLHVESVAWLSERKDVLSTFFWIAAMGAYARYARERNVRSYAAVLGLFVLGLMAKPMVISLPLVFLLLDYWPLAHERDERKRFWAYEKLPLVLLMVLSAAVTLTAQAQSMQSLERLPLAARIGNALVSYLRYIGKTLWPIDLMAFYPHPEEKLQSLWIASAAVLLGVTSFLCWQTRKARPYLLVGWSWFLVTLAPVIGLVQVGQQAMADRYMYIPSIGLFMMASWGLGDLASSYSWVRRPVMAAVSLCLVACLAATQLQADYWRDSISLWEHALRVEDRSDLAHFMLGAALNKQGRQEQEPSARMRLRRDAKAEFEAALRLNERYAEVHNNLGNMAHEEGRPKEAEDHFRLAIAIDPTNWKAHYNLANTYHELSRFREALQEYQSALETDPDQSIVHNGLGKTLARLGRVDEAIDQFGRAIQADPQNVDARANLALALNEVGRFDEAMQTYRGVLSRNPDHAPAANNLGYLFMQLGKLQDAIESFRRTVRADPRLANGWTNLGKCLTLSGDITGARAAFEQAARTAPTGPSFFDLAYVYRLARESQPAAGYLSRALELNPRWPENIGRAAWDMATSPQAGQRNGLMALFYAQEIAEFETRPTVRTLEIWAAALAECGRFNEAVQLAGRARTLAAQNGDTASLEALRSQLKAYENRRPFRAELSSSFGSNR